MNKDKPTHSKYFNNLMARSTSRQVAKIILKTHYSIQRVIMI